jgi:hypothetical protein
MTWPSVTCIRVAAADGEMDEKRIERQSDLGSFFEELVKTDVVQ